MNEQRIDILGKQVDSEPLPRIIALSDRMQGGGEDIHLQRFGDGDGMRDRGGSDDKRTEAVTVLHRKMVVIGRDDDGGLLHGSRRICPFEKTAYLTVRITEAMQVVLFDNGETIRQIDAVPMRSERGMGIDGQHQGRRG